jgi:predicted phosphate transport protein (TIGR00153 family)
MSDPRPQASDGTLFNLLPKETAFFDLFEKAAENAHQCTLALVELLDRFDDLEGRRRHVKELEHIGDELTHETIERLNRTFITPLDREDIHDLVCRIDDILDRVDTAVDRICLFKLERPMEESKQLARCLVRSTALIKEMLPYLRRMKGADEIRQRVREVHRVESEGDTLERQALERLFADNPDPILVIKWKNVIEVLESATDKCEDVANVIEGIVLKNG